VKSKNQLGEQTKRHVRECRGGFAFLVNMALVSLGSRISFLLFGRGFCFGMPSDAKSIQSSMTHTLGFFERKSSAILVHFGACVCISAYCERLELMAVAGAELSEGLIKGHVK
jgi:hypothetical protein